jgi:hypothetical protein
MVGLFSGNLKEKKKTGDEHELKEGVPLAELAKLYKEGEKAG